MIAEITNKSKEEKFIDYVLERIGLDTGFGAALRRADNPATEYLSWEHIAQWCDLDKDWERLPFTVIGASLANAKTLPNLSCAGSLRARPLSRHADCSDRFFA